MILANIIWDYHKLDNYNGLVDVIIGLGSYSMHVAKHAADLYHKGLAPYIVFTGDRGHWTDKLFSSTEAEVMKDIAIKDGVPENKIICETMATNTGENIKFSRDVLHRIGIKVSSILIVSKPNMMRRSNATCRKIWPEISVYNSSPNITLNEQAEVFHTEDMIVNEIVGDIKRINDYPARGYQIHQDIPSKVWDAFNELIIDGFSQHLPD